MAYAPLPHPYTSTMEHPPYTDSSKTSPVVQKESFLEDYTRTFGKPAPPPKKNVLVVSLLFIWKTLFLPMLGVAYIAFCYVCHHKLVKVGTMDDPMAHLSIIKAGVTSISILYVSLSFLPLYSLICDLKSEEFFRVLGVKHSGVPLDSMNSVSTPSYGTLDTVHTLYRRHGSSYFAGAFLAGFVALAASTLAPAALSVDTALFYSDIVALPMGAIQRNSVLNASDFTQPQTSLASNAALDRSTQGVAIAWAEINLGVNFSFHSPIIDQTTYLVPTPQKLSSTANSRWLSDVVAMQPTCEWVAPQVSNTSANPSDFLFNNSITVTLPLKNVQFSMDLPNPITQGFLMQPLLSGWANFGGRLTEMVDTNSMDDVTNGASAWVLLQCAAKCDTTNLINVTFGSDVPSAHYSSDSGAVNVSVLYCEPNAEIQTRHVSNNGQGILTVGDKVSPVQGNLHPVETNLLLSYVLQDLQDAGPKSPTNISTLGNQLQFSFVFGNASLQDSGITPQPINLITETYGRMLQSGTKPFMDGSLATTYVPGRTAQEIPVFAASLPHVIASTVLYAILSLFVFVCHFRRHVPQFTFFAVAASLARSDVPPLFAELKAEVRGPPAEDAVVATLGKARVMLEGGETLKLRNDIR